MANSARRTCSVLHVEGLDGADHDINYKTQDVAAEMLRLTDGKGVDLLVDTDLFGRLKELCYGGDARGLTDFPTLSQASEALA